MTSVGDQGSNIAKISSHYAAFETLAKDGTETLIRSRYPKLKDMRYIHTIATSPARVDGAALVAIANATVLDFVKKLEIDVDRVNGIMLKQIKWDLAV